MAAQRRSAFQQAGIQIDRALWCVQDHPGTSLMLGLPTLVSLAAVFVPLLLALRSYEFPSYLEYLIYVVALPTVAVMMLTFCPLPAAVFVHGLATGHRLTALACFRACLERPGRLARLAAGCVWRFALCAALLGLPALVLWPRYCLGTHVTLFEDERRVFWRSRKLLRDEAREAYHLLSLHAGIAIVLGLLVFAPRIVVSTRQLDLPALEPLRANLAVFEVVGLCLLLVGMATSWTLSLTFLYLEARATREGADLRRTLERVKAAHGLALVVFLVLTGSAGNAVAAEEAIRPDANAMAREVFRAPEFWWKKVERIHGPDVPAPLLDTLVRAGRWVLHAIGSLLQLLWPSGSPLALTNVLRYVALAVVIVWLVWLATRWREVWRWITPKVAAAPSVTSGGAVSTALPDVARLLDQAGTALEREQAESVVRFGFLAVIAWLTTHGLIPANRAHTNREHLDALHHPRAAPFREGFRRLALPYERVCYGQRAMTIDDARTFLADCRTLMADDAVPS